MHKIPLQFFCLIFHRNKFFGGKVVSNEKFACPLYVETWQDLYDKLVKLTPEQRNQSIQLVGCNPDHDKPLRLQPGYAFGSVRELFHDKNTDEVLQETKDIIGFAHKPENFVLCFDYSPFSEDGDSCYTLLEDGGMQGNVTGKVFYPGDKR